MNTNTNVKANLFVHDFWVATDWSVVAGREHLSNDVIYSDFKVPINWLTCEDKSRAS